jgi:hypothetical protein
MRGFVIALACLVPACGGSSPASPSPAPQQPPPPATWTLSGTVTDTHSGAPVSNAALDFWQLETVRTDASGRWTLRRTGVPASPIYAAVTADGYIERRAYVRWDSAGRADVAIDMIRDAAPFSLGFFRQIIRNDFDQPGTLQHMRRWTAPPNFYINTFNPRTGNSILQRQVDVIVDTIRRVIPQITAGRFGAGAIEAGLGPRPEEPGWIQIEITYEPNEDYCGRAQVAANPGKIWFNFERCVAVCRGEEIGPGLVSHEVGHAMGLWHHDQPGVMDRFLRLANCHAPDFSATERHHSAILYARQPGNADLDWDQPTTLTANSGGAAPVVTCGRPQ